MLPPVTSPLSRSEFIPVQRPSDPPAQRSTEALPAISPPEQARAPVVRATSTFDPAQLSFGADDEVIRTASPRMEALERSTGGYHTAIVSAAEVTATGEQFLERDRQARQQADPASLPAQGPAEVGLEHDVPAFTERLQDQLYEVTEAYSADPSPANRGRLRDASVAYNTWARFLSDHPQLETPLVTDARMRLEPALLDRVGAIRANRPLPPLPGLSPSPEEPLSSDWDTGVSAALQDRERVTTTADGDTTIQRETTYGVGFSAGGDRTSIGVGVRYSSASTDEENNRPRWEGDVHFSRPGVDINVGYRDGSGLSLSSPGWVIPVPRTEGRFGIQPSVFSNPTDEQPLDAAFRNIAGEREEFSPFRGTGLRLDLVRRF